MTLSFPYERADLRVQAPVTLVLQRLSEGNKNRSARDKRDNNSLTSQAIKASALPNEHFLEIIKNKRKTNTASDLYQFILQHTRLIYLFIYCSSPFTGDTPWNHWWIQQDLKWDTAVGCSLAFLPHADWYNRGLLWDLDYGSKEQRHQQAVAVHKGSSWEFGVLSAYKEQCGFGSCLCLAKDI